MVRLAQRGHCSSGRRVHWFAGQRRVGAGHWGGGEPGVLTVGYLATSSNGQTFVVAGMLSDPAAALPPSALPGLLAIVQAAFQLVR